MCIESFRTLLAAHRLEPGAQLQPGQARPCDLLGLRLQRTQYRIAANGR